MQTSKAGRIKESRPEGLPAGGVRGPGRAAALFLPPLLLLLPLFSGGCSLAPDYERPASPVEGSFPEYPEYRGPGAEERRAEGAGDRAAPDRGEALGDSAVLPEDLPWQDFYRDAGMRSLIAAALENNRDLRLALLNVEKNQALYRIQRSELFPDVAAGGAASNQRSRTFQAGPESAVARRYSLSVGITSYELDIFGRVRSLNEAALESYLASESAAYGARLAIIGEVASTYLQLVACREQYDLTAGTYASRRESHLMIEAMYRQGLASQLTVNQARMAVEEARVNAVNLHTTLLRLENALVLLLGGSLPPGLKIPSRLAEVERFEDIPVGVSSRLLERRPDILEAEHALKAANANIGAARASFFPSISLTSTLGLISADLDDLFAKDSRTWNFTPQVGLPLFTGGSLLANLEGAHIQRDMAVAAYEKAIQGAFREVADALAQRSTITEQLEAVKSLRDASQQSYDISNLRYEIGVDSFMNVLDAQRMLFSAQRAYIDSELQRELNSVNLYKSLGGGWK
ncbi:MAG: efflux transporter outer membrane subunit [Deltaproteobacteria bacterium]|jgi:multidrug efflux system outer membrane protein|nr:efflux transporter outer membrane subunit [Deltaproteobacteria bacterium]